jgi:hypothetical protein
MLLDESGYNLPNPVNAKAAYMHLLTSRRLEHKAALTATSFDERCENMDSWGPLCADP